MFIIPGFFISLLTFPGVIVHEWAHLVFCKLTGTPVLKVCYFRLGNPAGYVIHQQPRSVWRHILIGIGPFFVNTLIALLMGTAIAPKFIGFNHLTPAICVLLWLAISIGMHSFPSMGDARAIWKAIWSPGAPFTARILGSPLVAIIFLGAIGSVVWLDAIYGAVVVLAVPAIWGLSSESIPGLHLNPPPGDLRVALGRAVDLYPDLVVAHSTLNEEFVRRYQQYEKVKPDYFNNPEWPTYLAHESQNAIRKH
jgi:hypothetical protein